MLKHKKVLILLALYLFITTAVYLLQPQNVKGDSLRFFFQDPNISGRLRDEMSYDRSGNTIIITRAYHNKVDETIQVFFINLYRSIDIPFLYSLSPISTIYEDHGRIPMMFPIEFPFFLLACWHLIRHWQNYKKQYFFLIPLLIVSLFICGLFYPAIHVVKLLLLVITLRLITFIGIYEFIVHSRWVKK